MKKTDADSIATIEMIEQENLLANAKHLANVFSDRLSALKDECDLVEEVRIKGMMIGIQLSIDGTSIVQRSSKVSMND